MPKTLDHKLLFSSFSLVGREQRRVCLCIVTVPRIRIAPSVRLGPAYKLRKRSRGKTGLHTRQVRMRLAREHENALQLGLDELFVSDLVSFSTLNLNPKYSVSKLTGCIFSKPPFALQRRFALYFDFAVIRLIRVFCLYPTETKHPNSAQLVLILCR